LGQSIGDAVIARAKSDGFDSVFIGSFPPMTGVWSNSNPVYPLAGSWKPWALSSGSQLRLPPPPDFGTDEFQAQVNALKQFGRTVASNHTAWFSQPSFIDLVGSGAGAVIRRKLLGRIRRFRLRARLGASVIPFPAPATSHAAGRFPALRAPAHFAARFMRPKAGPSSGCIVRTPGPAD